MPILFSKFKTAMVYVLITSIVINAWLWNNLLVDQLANETFPPAPTSRSNTTLLNHAPTTTTNEKEATKKFKVFHVMNIYAINKDNYNKTEDGSILHHQPFDQWVTIQSIERAKQHMPPELEMTVVCAILRSDWDILSDETVPICDRRVLLERSTLTEYGGRPKKISFSGFGYNNNNTKQKNEDKKHAQMTQFISELFSKRELPFMQDIIDAVVSIAKESIEKHTLDDRNSHSNSNTYIMLTNADIGLSEFFYQYLYQELEEGRTAFAINRMTLPMVNQKKKRHPPITVRNPTTNQTEIKTLFAQINKAMTKGLRHPGTDCFIINSSIMQKVFLGDQLPGYSPWAGSLKVLLRDILAKGTFIKIESTPQGTFHLGDDRTWKKQSIHKQERDIFHHLLQWYKLEISDCPVQRIWENIHTALSTASCGMIYREKYPEFLSEVMGGICPYKRIGWVNTNHSGCEHYRLGTGPYPWGEQTNNEQKDPTKKFNY